MSYQGRKRKVKLMGGFTEMLNHLKDGPVKIIKPPDKTGLNDNTLNNGASQLNDPLRANLKPIKSKINAMLWSA